MNGLNACVCNNINQNTDGLDQKKHNYCLTHWGRVMHICVSKQTSIDSDNVLSPGRCQAIIWTKAAILLIGPLGTNFSEISIEIHILSFKKMHLKMSSGKWQPFCHGLNELYTGFIELVLLHMWIQSYLSYLFLWELRADSEPTHEMVQHHKISEKQYMYNV